MESDPLALAVEALEKFGGHDPGCPIRHPFESRTCICGYNKALAALRRARERAEEDAELAALRRVAEAAETIAKNGEHLDSRTNQPRLSLAHWHELVTALAALRQARGLQHGS